MSRTRVDRRRAIFESPAHANLCRCRLRYGARLANSHGCRDCESEKISATAPCTAPIGASMRDNAPKAIWTKAAGQHDDRPPDTPCRIFAKNETINSASAMRNTA